MKEIIIYASDGEPLTSCTGDKSAVHSLYDAEKYNEAYEGYTRLYLDGNKNAILDLIEMQVRNDIAVNKWIKAILDLFEEGHAVLMMFNINGIRRHYNAFEVYAQQLPRNQPLDRRHQAMIANAQLFKKLFGRPYDYGAVYRRFYVEQMSAARAQILSLGDQLAAANTQLAAANDENKELKRQVADLTQRINTSEYLSSLQRNAYGPPPPNYEEVFRHAGNVDANDGDEQADLSADDDAFTEN